MGYKMWIKKIKLNNFRNYQEQEINFEKNINIFYGENAQGKTNIIEAIFLCSLGKSFRAKKDSEMIKLNEKNSLIEIEYEKSDRDGKIKIELCVIFTPDYINILKGGPQNRRRFLDIMISQLRPNYMHILNSYLKIIEQRNKYLRQIKEERKDENLLDIWDEKLAEYAIKICEYRQEFIEKITNKIEKIHNNITNEKEKIEIEYITECNNKENYLKLLKERRKLDIIKGFTTKGVHRDDFVIYINKKEINIYGSQGQNRTAMLSLKLSELQVIKDEIGEYPILLLDDFMSELDSTRRKNFLENIKDTQVIITGTEKLDIENLEYLEYNVSNGKIFKQK